MPVDYDAFRSQSWSERVAIFNSISPEEKADLVRTHISRWLTAHLHELTDAQIGLVEENIAMVTPGLYALAVNEDAKVRMKDLLDRTGALLSREQMREALTMHWEQSSQQGR